MCNPFTDFLSTMDIPSTCFAGFKYGGKVSVSTSSRYNVKGVLRCVVFFLPICCLFLCLIVDALEKRGHLQFMIIIYLSLLEGELK